MIENQVTVSDDKRTMTIVSPQGNRATLGSARAEGFIHADIEKARTAALNQSLEPGQINRAHRFKIGAYRLYVHINTGPPTWLLPRILFQEGSLVTGWFRLLVGVSLSRRDATAT